MLHFPLSSNMLYNIYKFRRIKSAKKKIFLFDHLQSINSDNSDWLSSDLISSKYILMFSCVVLKTLLNCALFVYFGNTIFTGCLQGHKFTFLFLTLIFLMNDFFTYKEN